MSKVAKKIDPVVIDLMKKRIQDPDYIQVAVSNIAGIISIQLLFETR